MDLNDAHLSPQNLSVWRSLTEEQQKLLLQIVGVHDLDYKSPFILTVSHSGSYLVYNGYRNTRIDADRSDFELMQRLGLLSLVAVGDSISGKPTRKGIELVHEFKSPAAKAPPKRDEPIIVPVNVPQRKAYSVNSDGGDIGVKTPTAIFIGHGHSREWMVLEKYLTRDLKLNCEEFNATPAAGRTTQAQVEGMLNRATFAFIVFTGEDMHADGALHARENVIHEAGLFQGKLGFEDAVLLVEKGCVIPSNLYGLTHIPFPKEEIKAAFHDIRQLLEHRKIIAGY